MANEIINKVAQANIVQIDLSDYLPKSNIATFDIKQALWQNIIVKEKEYRAYIKSFDWSVYKNKIVAVFCSADTIIPAWAYMLVTTQLIQVNATVFYGNQAEVKAQIFFKNLFGIKVEKYKGARVMVKGCSDIPNPEKAYIELTKLMIPVVKSFMFGEPCSAVPVYKRQH